VTATHHTAGDPGGLRQIGPRTRRRLIVGLDDPGALEATVVGGKAANLARSRALGLPVLPGFVVTGLGPSAEPAALAGDGDLRRSWQRLGGERHTLIVRSSAATEDLPHRSMAGQFLTVPGVRTWEAFCDAVVAVAGSGSVAGNDEEVAVLVQPVLDARLGGVLFTIDPVSGREDWVVVVAATGGADRVASGEVEGHRYTLTASGRRVSRQLGTGGARLPRRTGRRLATMARDLTDAFGGPQDIEWAVDRDGRMWLFQTRPVTTPTRGKPQGPILGPGPVAETFPEPLSPLEADLWVPPLRQAITTAVSLAGSVPARQLERSPVVAVIGGRVAVDLELVGELPARRPVVTRLDPRPAFRRLRAAWRVGRLRVALPGIARMALEEADRELAQVPELAGLTERQLVALVQRGRRSLSAVHANEILIGLLADASASGITAASVALRVVDEGRRVGRSQAEIVADHPVALALVPPRVGPELELPDDIEPLPPAAEAGDEIGLLREGLRLRARWYQEVTGRAAWELGRRLADRGLIDAPATIRRVGLDQLVEHVERGTRGTVAAPSETDGGPSLPAAFRLSDRGVPVAQPVSGRPCGGTGAGGGSGQGMVSHDVDDPEPGSVLVVGSLDPRLAPVVGRLAGLVAETGSPLAHLAILAREAGVPTVVGAAGALEAYPEGVEISVDGESGALERKGQEDER
jgi:rifampicin phosphotransferase